MAVIGILIAFILTAATAGLRSAERAATEALISKLETGLLDRIDALLDTKPQANYAHAALATAFPTASTPMPSYVTVLAPDGTMYLLPQKSARAQVFAQYDYIKSELPDFWTLNKNTFDSANYALDFGAFSPYPSRATGDFAFVLPLGNSVPAVDTSKTPPVPTGGDVLPGAIPAASHGIYGAAYTAAAGIYKQLGFLTTGYDGLDNDGDGLIDEIGESGMTLAAVQTKLASHNHRTARAEMLYALMVESASPLGSIYNKDDFTDKEVQDTDGDGLLEFVDAWGQPLQFFRWPIYFHSDSQKGVTPTATGGIAPPYASAFEPREQSPVDPNQQIMALQWWSVGFNAWSPNTITGFKADAVQSAGAVAFTTFFHQIIEPGSSTAPTISTTTGSPNWDRGSATYQRRAFALRPLILSGGPDKQVGVAKIEDFMDVKSLTAAQWKSALWLENQARQCSLDGSAPYYAPSSFNPMIVSQTVNLQDAAADDINSHNLFGAGGALK
jgi:hypothetical protein